MKNRPIGVFDSGIGGLAIAKVLKQIYPNENFIYIADLKNVPYGPKSKEEIRTFVENITAYFVEKNAKAIVIACNTASTVADNLNLDIPIIKMIEPTIAEVLQNKDGNNVLLLATERTVNSKVYEKPLLDHGLTLYKKAMPEFVLLVEDLQIETSKSYKVVNDLLKEYKNKNINTVILGCTHFGFLTKEIKEVLPNAKQISGANMVAFLLEEYLKENIKKTGEGSFTLLTTKGLEELKRKAKFLKIEYNEIKEINI